MKTKNVSASEYLEIDQELLEMAGSQAAYEALLEDMGRQLRAIAKTGHRIIMDGDNVVRVTLPYKQRPKNKRS